MKAPADDPLRRVADLPPPADQEAALRALVGAIPAGQAVGSRLPAMLRSVVADEPPVGDAVDDVFRRATAARHRRALLVLAASVAAVVVVALIGYAVTTVLLPATATQSPAAETNLRVPPADPVLALLTPVLAASGLTAVPREPAHGDGWRQYLVLAAQGRSYGLLEVSVYAAPGGICLPVLADKSACARPEHTDDDVDYARYAFDKDVDWQVTEAIARHDSDGRVIVVQATGERGTGSADKGRPSLTGKQAAKLASDPLMAAAFAAGEACTGPDSACPVLKVPVPAAR